jgi:hypothetical protein
MKNFPLLFLNSSPASARNKKANLYNKLKKKLHNQIMTFVVRLHYANYPMVHLFKVESSFDFRTYPLLSYVLEALENEMDGLSRRIRRSVAKAPKPVEEDGDASDGKKMNDRLSTVVNNACAALREFEKYVRDNTNS